MADPHNVKPTTTEMVLPVLTPPTQKCASVSYAAVQDWKQPMSSAKRNDESSNVDVEHADELRKAKRREQQRRRRARETEEKAIERRSKDAAAHSQSRKSETEEQKQERRKKDAASKKRKHEAETPEEAERRRGIYREHRRLIWGTGTRKEEVCQLLEERSYVNADGKKMVLTDQCRKHGRMFSYKDEGQQSIPKEELLEIKKQYAAEHSYTQ